MITLYGCRRSRASRPIWLLEELGQPFTLIPVIQAYRLPDPDAADAPLNTRSASYLAVNPIGQIPALVDGDLVLTESLAMCLHLARSAGGPLAPATPDETALTENWMLFAATSVEADALTVMMGASDAEKAAAAERLNRPFARLEAHLAGRDWLLDRFTVADIIVAECVRYAQGDAGLMAAYPAITAWLARCHARPAFQRMWQARLAEPA